MDPTAAYVKRFEALLAELDDAADDVDDDDAAEALDDLNAEFEDALFMLSQIRPQDDGAAEDMNDTLETLRALAEDYRALEGGGEAVRELADRLFNLAGMALRNMNP